MKTLYRMSLLLLIVGLLSLNIGSTQTLAGDDVQQGAELLEVPELVIMADDVRGGSDVRIASPLNSPQAGVECATMSVTYSPGWPTDAQTAFAYAVDIWETQVCSDVTITISATWESLGPGVLGSAGAGSYYRDFTGAPYTGTWYQVALANKYYGSDLDLGGYDIEASFNSGFSLWYFGTDGNPGSSEYDFVTVVLHEIGHGLGFAGSMTVDGVCGSGNGCWGWGSGYPFIYDRFTEDSLGNNLIDTEVYPNPSAILSDTLTSGAVFFNGTNAGAANGGTRVPLFAPYPWQPGSSYSHVDDIYNGTPNALMTWSLTNGESQHDPGPVMLGIFEDIGWTTPFEIYIPLILKNYTSP